MRHSTKRHTHTQNSSHITQNLSQITQNLSQITQNLSHITQITHDTWRANFTWRFFKLTHFRSYLRKWSCQLKSSTNLHFKTYRLRVGKALVAFFFLFLQKLKYWTTEPCTSPKGRRRSCYGVCLITGCRKLIKYKKQRVMRVERWSEGTDGNLVEDAVA